MRRHQGNHKHKTPEHLRARLHNMRQIDKRQRSSHIQCWRRTKTDMQKMLHGTLEVIEEDRFVRTGRTRISNRVGASSDEIQDQTGHVFRNSCPRILPLLVIQQRLFRPLQPLATGSHHRNGHRRRICASSFLVGSKRHRKRSSRTKEKIHLAITRKF